MNTKITKNLLKEKKAPEGLIEYFESLNIEEITIDNLLIQVRKDKKNYSYLLFITFNLSGLCEEFYESGNTLARCNYKNGKLHGLCEESYESGKIKVRYNYEHYKLQGLSEIFYENENIMGRCNYENGNCHGLCEKFDEDGKIIATYNYENGKLIN